MLDLLKKLNTEIYDVVCSKKIYYNVKILEELKKPMKMEKLLLQGVMLRQMEKNFLK